MKNKAVKKVILELVAGVLLIVGLTGCKDTEGTIPEASNAEVVSEVESEVIFEEVSESVSEEVVAEEVSEPELIDGVQMLYCESYEEMETYFEGLENAVVVVFEFYYPEEGQALLYNEAHYTIKDEFFMRIETPKEVEYINSNLEYVNISTSEEEGKIQIKMTVETTGADIEVPITIKYTDGTEETLTVYITKDWKYPWEE